MTDDCPRELTPDATHNQLENTRGHRRKYAVLLLLFIVWLVVGVAMFMHILENKDKKDADGNYVIWPSKPAEEE
jgi:hypothetical protein